MFFIKHYNCTLLHGSSYKPLGISSIFRALEFIITEIITIVIANFNRVLPQPFKILSISHTLFHLIPTTIQEISLSIISIFR